MRLSVMGALAMLALAACGAQPEPSIDAAWVRLPAVPGRPGAAYFTLKAGAQPLTLVSIRTPAAKRAELHESMESAGGMMSMAPLKLVDVPAGGTLTFAPAGKHAMLFDMNPALKPGGTTSLTLSFADGKTIEVPAQLRGAGDAVP